MPSPSAARSPVRSLPPSTRRSGEAASVFTLIAGTAKWRILMAMLNCRGPLSRTAMRDMFEGSSKARYFVGLNWDRRAREMTAAGMLVKNAERWAVNPDAYFVMKERKAM